MHRLIRTDCLAAHVDAANRGLVHTFVCIEGQSASQFLLTSAAGKQCVSSIVSLSAFLPVSLMPSYVVAVLQLVLVPGGLRLLRSQYPCCYVEGIHLSSAAVQRCVSAKFCNSAFSFSVYGELSDLTAVQLVLLASGLIPQTVLAHRRTCQGPHLPGFRVVRLD